MIAAEAVHPADARGEAPRLLWRAVLAVTTAVGLLSGLRIYFTYNVLGARVSMGDSLASGLLDWWCWIPLVPPALYLVRTFDPSRVRRLTTVGVHAIAAVAAALLQLSLFSALSGVIRAIRFDHGFRFDVTAPLLQLAPSIAAYWIFAVAVWWHASRRQLAEARRPEPAAPNAPVVAFREGRRELLVRPDELDWVAAAGNYLELHGCGRSHLVRDTLKSAHRKLGPEFVRIHRSTLVRRDAVASVLNASSAADVVLTDGTRLSIGRKFRDAASELRP